MALLEEDKFVELTHHDVGFARSRFEYFAVTFLFVLSMTYLMCNLRT